MRRKVNVERLRQFMDELAALAQSPGKVYFTGGATALLLGFREQTIDIDIKLDPEPKGVFEAIARLKNSLDLLDRILSLRFHSPGSFKIGTRTSAGSGRRREIPQRRICDRR